MVLLILLFLLCYNRIGENIQLRWGRLTIKTGQDIQQDWENNTSFLGLSVQHDWETITTKMGNLTSEMGKKYNKFGERTQQNWEKFPRLCCIDAPVKLYRYPL